MIGVGVDLLKIERIKKAMSNNPERFPKKVLSDIELTEFDRLDRGQENFVAKRFAVKEAVAKALGTGFSSGVSWRDISLLHDSNGKPVVTLTDGAQSRFEELNASSLQVSLSDDAGFVIAYANLS